MIARPVPYPSSMPCDPSHLRRLLADDLNDQELDWVTQHLDQCDACRSQLDRAAHSDPDWIDSKSTIRKDLGQSSSLMSLGFIGEETTDKPSSTHSKALISWLKPPKHEDTKAGFVGVLDRYLIKRVVGTGGMGVVLEGWDEQLHRPVAIKAMHPHLASIAIARQRFVREARAAAAIVHPNVVAIHAVNADFDPPYLVMPLIAGESLQSRIDRSGPLEMDAVLRIASQVADGLAAAHAQGLVHRDVKPANILVEHGTERALITDFGVVRALDDATMTTSGAIAGTPEYMSPEQARGDSLDHRSDLFSLGSVMYAMLVGRSPFRADSPLSVLRRITDDSPRPLRAIHPHTPAWMESLLGWLHEKDPNHRARSAEEVAIELRKALSYWHDPLHHPLPSAIALRMRRAVPQQFLPWLVCGVLATLAVVAFLFAFNSNRVQQTDRNPGSSSFVTNDSNTSESRSLESHSPGAIAEVNSAAPLSVIPADSELGYAPAQASDEFSSDIFSQFEIDGIIDWIDMEIEAIERSMQEP